MSNHLGALALGAGGIGLNLDIILWFFGVESGDPHNMEVTLLGVISEQAILTITTTSKNIKIITN